MQRPDDVTQEAWTRAMVVDAVAPHERRLAIARTIMAAEKRGEERERRAAIADCQGYRDQFAHLPDCAAKSAGDGASMIIENAIRMRW